MIIFNCERTQCKFFGNNFFVIILIENRYVIELGRRCSTSFAKQLQWDRHNSKQISSLPNMTTRLKNVKVKS
jgi:hypothetical protein